MPCSVTSGPEMSSPRASSIVRESLSVYLLSSTHPDGKIKLRLWRSVFGIEEDDAELLERPIREQLEQATPEERPPKKVMEPDRTVRQWELLIPRFRGRTATRNRARRGGPRALQ
jgi:hypothetical protein